MSDSARSNRRNSQIDGFGRCALAAAITAAVAFGANAAAPETLGPDHKVIYHSAPSAAAPLDIASAYIADNLSNLGLTSADLATLKLDREFETEDLGANVFYIQHVNGVPVFNAITSVHIMQNGQIFKVNNSAVKSAALNANALVPQLSPADAYLAGVRHLGAQPAEPTVLTAMTAARQGVAFTGEGATLRPVPVQLMYVPQADGSIRLAWEMYAMTDNDHVWYMHVDANDGAILNQINLSFALDRYRVYGISSESPISTESPEDVGHEMYAELRLSASPRGWHTSNSTSGNNVFAVEDRDDNGLGGSGFFSPDDGYQPQGTMDALGNLTFDFAHDDTRNPCMQPGPDANIASSTENLVPCDAYDPNNPNTNLDAAIVNLFYWNNIIHDVMFYYGFTEEAGNFQTENYTRAGLVGGEFDAVFAQAQDGSGTNNANFFTPPDDGITPMLLPPAMQMYEWSPPAALTVNVPADFSDFDDGDNQLQAATASFGANLKNLSQAERTGDLELGNDGNPGDGTGTENDGCEPLVGFTPGKIALLDRGACEFGVKALNAEQAGAKAMVLANTLGRELGASMGPGEVGGQVTIPSIMIGMSNGAQLKNAIANGGANVTLEASLVASRDSDFDNGVIAHEYGHGISNRLVGGPSSIACLFNALEPDASGALSAIGEQMGEGWSDLYGLILTAQPSDTAEQPRGVGAYISFQDEDGPGIRRYPYSRDMSVNPFTYADVPGETPPHGVGTVWGTMVWDMYWNLVDKHGFEPDLLNHKSGAGNVRALKLINQGLQVTKCRPGFTDGRNAILAAEAADGNIDDSCPIWEAFARRGLGVAAVNPSGGEDHRQVVEDFTVPAHCAVTGSAPNAASDSFSTSRNSSLSVAAPGVLANDVDVDFDAMTVKLIDGPAQAESFSLNPDGSFNYTPKSGYTGSDSFTYVAQDGATSSRATTVVLNVTLL